MRHVERHEKREQAAAGGKPSASQARLPSDASTSPADLPFPPPTPAPAPVYPPGNMSWHDQQALQQAHFSFDTQRFAFDASGKTLSPTSPNPYPSPLAIPSFHPEPSPFDQPLDPSLGPSFFNPLPAASSTSSLPSFDDPLNFIQSSYGAPFVSASEYGWLFDPSSSFDVSGYFEPPRRDGGSPSFLCRSRLGAAGQPALVSRTFRASTSGWGCRGHWEGTGSPRSTSPPGMRWRG